MTSYEVLCENFDWEEQKPSNKSFISCARTQPGRERMQTSYSDEDICAEIGDDDLEAARDAGIFAAMVWKMISANVFFTWGPGPGHGLKNARRFASEGDCDLKLAEQHGNKMYGVGHQHAQEAASPNALNISISQKRDDDGNIDHGYIVHVHFFRKWNWHRTVTIKYELLRLHSGEWHLIGHNDDDERLLLQLSAAAGFVQNSQQLQELIHWVSNEQGTLPGNRDKRTTGVARFMLNLRPKYRETFTDETKLDEFIKNIEKSYLRRDDYSLQIMGRLITPLYDIASMVEVLRTIQLNNCVVQIGRRKNPTEISTQGYYIENDPLFRPVIIADHRILQDHEGVCEEYFNSTKRTESQYTQKMCQSLSCIFHKSYMKSITNARTTPLTNRRVGVDFVVLLRVKPQMCGVNTHKCLKGDLMNVLKEVDKNHSDKLISNSKNMQELKQWIEANKKEKKEKDKQKKKQKKENQFKKKKNNSKKRAASSGRSAQPVPKKPRTGTPSEKQKKHEELPPDSGSEKQQKHEELPPDSGSASDNSESDSGSGADAETPPDSGSDGSMTTPPPASVGSTTPPDSGSASDNSESDSGSGADAETPPDSGSGSTTTEAPPSTKKAKRTDNREPSFKSNVTDEYNRILKTCRCTFTGLGKVEAAHIVSVNAPKDFDGTNEQWKDAKMDELRKLGFPALNLNSPENGLLLTPDLHAAYDYTLHSNRKVRISFDKNYKLTNTQCFFNTDDAFGLWWKTHPKSLTIPSELLTKGRKAFLKMAFDSPW